MAGKNDPSRQSWGTFLRNHMPHIAAMHLFVVPTIGFNLLYVLVIVRLARRELIWINVTAHPTAEWIAQQLTEAFPWTEAPRYLIRDRDGIYGLRLCADYELWAPRQAHCPELTSAECVCGETDRHDPTGMSRPHDRVWGGTPAPDPWEVCRLS